MRLRIRTLRICSRPSCSFSYLSAQFSYRISTKKPGKVVAALRNRGRRAPTVAGGVSASDSFPSIRVAHLSTFCFFFLQFFFRPFFPFQLLGGGYRVFRLTGRWLDRVYWVLLGFTGFKRVLLRSFNGSYQSAFAVAVSIAIENEEFRNHRVLLNFYWPSCGFGPLLARFFFVLSLSLSLLTSLRKGFLFWRIFFLRSHPTGHWPPASDGFISCFLLPSFFLPGFTMTVSLGRDFPEIWDGKITNLHFSSVDAVAAVFSSFQRASFCFFDDIFLFKLISWRKRSFSCGSTRLVTDQRFPPATIRRNAGPCFFFFVFFKFLLLSKLFSFCVRVCVVFIFLIDRCDFSAQKKTK